MRTIGMLVAVAAFALIGAGVPRAESRIGAAFVMALGHYGITASNGGAALIAGPVLYGGHVYLDTVS